MPILIIPALIGLWVECAPHHQHLRLVITPVKVVAQTYAYDYGYDLKDGE